MNTEQINSIAKRVYDANKNRDYALCRQLMRCLSPDDYRAAQARTSELAREYQGPPAYFR